MPRENLTGSSRGCFKYGRCEVYAAQQNTHRIERSSCLKNPRPQGGIYSSAKLPLIFTLNQYMATLWTQAEKGSGSAIFITGERGIGKTELVRGFVGTLEQPLLHAWVSCSGRGKHGEFLPFRLMLDVVGAQHPQAYADVYGGRQSFWIEGPAADSVLSRGAASGADLGIEMLQILTALTGHRPLLLVFEDIHRASQPSINLLELIASQSHRLRLLLVCEYRPLEADEYLQTMVAGVDHHGGQIMSLEPLSKKDLRRFVIEDCDGSFSAPPWFYDDLLNWSGGTPFYLRLRIEGLKRVEAMKKASHAWTLA